jgi:flagellar motor switch protein FliG
VTAPAPTSLNGIRKAAILLVLLGDEVASGIYRNLPDEELRTLTHEIASLDYISPEVASAVLQEYQTLTATQQHVAQGGPDYANKLLVKSLGEEGAQAMMAQVMEAQEASAQSLDALQKADPQQLAKFLQGEHPQTIALVLAHLNSKIATSILLLLPKKVRSQTVKRLAEMQNFSPEMVQKIAMVLHRKLMALGEQSRRAYGGVKAVADLLNRMNVQVTSNILEGIEKENSQLAASIRNLMFTFDDFLDVPETGMRELVGTVDKKLMATALKGASEELKEHFFKCMSSRAVEMMKEDMEALGPVRAKDVGHAQTEIVAHARKLEADGKMVLKSETEDAYVV